MVSNYAILIGRYPITQLFRTLFKNPAKLCKNELVLINDFFFQTKMSPNENATYDFYLMQISPRQTTN